MTSFQSYRDQRFPVSNIRLLETDGMSITWGTFHLTDELYMKNYRTVACVIIMAIAAIAGFFIGATLDEAMGGAILFSMIAGIACIVYSIENREE